MVTAMSIMCCVVCDMLAVGSSRSRKLSSSSPCTAPHVCCLSVCSLSISVCLMSVYSISFCIRVCTYDGAFYFTSVCRSSVFVGLYMYLRYVRDSRSAYAYAAVHYRVLYVPGSVLRTPTLVGMSVILLFF